MSPLFIITGLSGAGKSTVAEALMRDTSLGLRRFVTTTTREPRPNETNGVHYWFVSQEEFQHLQNHGDLYEAAEVYGNFYGSSKSKMQTLMQAGEPILLVVDVQGAETFKKIHPDAHIIFLVASRHDLSRRLHERQSSEADIEQRLEKTDEELRHENVASIIIENPDGQLDHTLQQVREFILNEIKTP